MKRYTQAQQAGMYYSRKRRLSRLTSESTPAGFASNLVAWFRFDAGVTLNDNDEVVSWRDVINNIELTHTTGDALPTLTPTGIHYAGGSSGGNAGGLQGSITIGAGVSHLAVFALASQDSHALGDGRLVSYAATGRTVDYDSETSAVLLMSIAPNETDHDGIWSLRNLIDGAKTDSGTWPNGTLKRLAILQLPTGSEAYIDNVLLASDAAQTFGNFGATGTLAIGGIAVESNLNHSTFSGTVREVIIAKGTITAAQRLVIDEYLATRMP